MKPLYPRYLSAPVMEDLEEKMVFIGGPRQVGKTTLAEMIAARFDRFLYLNWDNRTHRRNIMDEKWSPDVDLLIFDEIHKYTKWKSLIKGIYDTRSHGQKIVVTGSAKLNLFRRGGDSLLGRYRYYRLHPFSLRERNEPDLPFTPHLKLPELCFDSVGRNLNALMTFGGFPEPLLKGKERTLKRWQTERFERVFREDIRDTEIIRSLSQIEMLGYLLPRRVGAPLSMNAIASEIEVSPKTISNWLELLSRNYYTFRVPPYYKRLNRALKKESKYYLWDWSEVPGKGERFENLVGVHLLKFCHYCQDTCGVSAELFYLRDLDKREVDFLVTWEHKPWLIVECKLKPGDSLTPTNFFSDRLGISERYVVTCEEDVDHRDRRTGIRSISANRFLMALI